MTRRDVAQAISGALLPIGFHRTGTRWHRTSGVITDVVALTVSKGGDTLNVAIGVFDPVPYEPVWGAVPKAITEADCVVRVDLGFLCGVLGAWSPEDPAARGRIVRSLEECGIPWLDSMRSATARVEFLRGRHLMPGETVLLAMSEAALGDLDMARERLSGLRGRLTGGPWRDTVDQLLSGMNSS